jgi:micrococcal nuclease
MRKSKRKVINLVIEVFLIVLISIVLALNSNDNRISVTLSDCVDGDTAKFVTPDGIETVRFLAIDTPETVHPTKGVEPFGKEASAFTCNELNMASSITLEMDMNSDKYDKYKRLLAWVFVDNNLLQSKLIEKGYAKVAYLYGDYKYTGLLLSEEENAKANKLGIWYNE